MTLRLSTVAFTAVVALTALPSVALAERSTPGQPEARVALELMPVPFSDLCVEYDNTDRGERGL